MRLYEELKWRNLIKDCSDSAELEKTLNEKKIRFYCGFDPTADSLTIGHLVLIITIILFKKKGHIPFILLGGATSLIGDPKELEERKLLDVNSIESNLNKIQNQLQEFLSIHSDQFINNNDWISRIDLITFFRVYGKLFNVNYMISKEKIAKRLVKGISYTEFSYMLLQAFDFHQLYKNNDVYLQIGGSDQWGNITSGLELIRKIEKSKKVFGMSVPLLIDSKGIKFGKSEKNVLWLDSAKTNPYELYQFFFNVSDKEVINYLKILTLIEPQEILLLEKELQKNPQKRLAQKKLASSIIAFLHGKQVSQTCIKLQEILFSRSLQSLQIEDFQLLQKHLPVHEVIVKANLVDSLVATKLASSKKESRQLIKAGAIKIFPQSNLDIDYDLTVKQTFYQKYILLIKKNKKHALVIWK